MTLKDATTQAGKAWQEKLAELQQLRKHFKSEHAAGRAPHPTMVSYEHTLANEVGKLRREFAVLQRLHGLTMHAMVQARIMQRAEPVETVEELVSLPNLFGYSPNN